MNLPNTLTLIRIFIVPLLVVVLLTPFSDRLGVPRHILGVVLFLAAAATDYFDGYFARKRNQVSRLGQLLDPLADKLLISAALIALVDSHLAPAWAVVIIVGREFAVTGLRSIAASDGLIIAASPMGKLKMAAQVFAVSLLIVSSTSGNPPVSNLGMPYPAIAFWTVPEVRAAFDHVTGPAATSWTDLQVLLYTSGRAMLWIVVLSAFYSMFGYFRAFYLAATERDAAMRKAEKMEAGVSQVLKSES